MWDIEEEQKGKGKKKTKGKGSLVFYTTMFGIREQIYIQAAYSVHFCILLMREFLNHTTHLFFLVISCP